MPILCWYWSSCKNSNLRKYQIETGYKYALLTRNAYLQMRYNCQLSTNASIKSKREHPPRANPRGIFLRWSKALPRGKIFLQKHGPRGKKAPTPGEYFRRSCQLFLLIGVEILGFCINQTLKRIGRLSNYSLVIPSSLSLSTILKILKFSPSFETDFVTREHQ